METPTVTVMQTVIAAMGDVFTLVGTISRCCCSCSLPVLSLLVFVSSRV